LAAKLLTATETAATPRCSPRKPSGAGTPVSGVFLPYGRYRIEAGTAPTIEGWGSRRFATVKLLLTPRSHLRKRRRML